jgi:hypothetical protein
MDDRCARFFNSLLEQLRRNVVLIQVSPELLAHFLMTKRELHGRPQVADLATAVEARAVVLVSEDPLIGE